VTTKSASTTSSNPVNAEVTINITTPDNVIRANDVKSAPLRKKMVAWFRKK
jgi:hypothetical protein